MRITKPSYFDDFHCIASRCPDSCCKEWDVQVDPEAAALYRSLPGPLGDRLREVLQTEDGETVMTIVDGRCPMWRSDGLCRIQAELGEQALCRTCREFPRLTHDYGDFLERQLELSCPEAARILLTAPYAPPVTEEVPGGSEAEYDGEAMAVLKQTRQAALALLSDPLRSAREVLALLLLYGCQAQEALDGGEALSFDAEAALETIREFARPGSIREVLDFFSGLEILTPQWNARLQDIPSGQMPETVRALARYLVERYWLQAVSDYDLACRVKFILISCLVVCALGGDFIATAQLFSKEIENNYDNVEAILDAAYTSPIFTDDKLLGMLLGLAES
ncbi:MAG: flagellin lysine-N-methylase [Oscillospiraceae bacterium]|nr:flagellin lysine-N-methylase [Oscillospiraceae bacterium]